MPATSANVERVSALLVIFKCNRDELMNITIWRF